MSSRDRPPSERRPSILLVEDENAHAELIQRAFQAWEQPVRLTLAHSLREAQDRLAESVPDLVIADLLLPDGRGVELVPPADRSGPAYPVVVMTSHGDEKIAVDAMKAGALDYVVKSVETLADMPHIAERALREWRQIIAHKRAEDELKTRTQQLLALSYLGQQVLSGTEIPALMTEAIGLIGQTLELPHVTLLERCTDTGALLLRAAIGRPEALLGQPTAADPHTLGGLTLAGSEPLVVEDLRQDPRLLEDSLWRGPPLVSGVSVPVGGPEEPLGVLWAFAYKRRDFTDDEIHFLRSAANVLAVTIERQRTEARTHKLQHELLRVSRASAMGELGTAVAHELNQPITAVMNYVQASRRLLAASDGRVSEETLELMGEAVGEAERAGAILRHLRQFVEKGELQRTVQDLNGAVHDAAKLALAEAAEKNIHVSFELGGHLPRVFIDKIQVQQVVFNLVRNAMEALDGSPRREITIGTLRGGDDTVEILVRDTGPGVDPSVVDHLFTEYFSTKERGMGVGLSISQSIIDAHGGRLWVTATPGGGAIFHFTLPIVGSDHEG